LTIFTGFVPLDWVTKASPLTWWTPDGIIAAVRSVEIGEEPKAAGWADRTRREIMDRQRIDVWYLRSIVYR
jgi:hypothetical protein